MPELPSSVTLGTGAGGLDVVRIGGPDATAEVYLHGAHVTAWAPTGGPGVLWMSDASRFTPGSPIRGGVPICFPWFGAHATDASAPPHGFARSRVWELLGADETPGAVAVSLVLRDDETSRRSPWPHPFEAVYTVTVGRTLTLTLEVTNRDEVEVSFEEALHTYLAVDDVRHTEVTGLEGVPFVDRLAGPAEAEASPVRFTAETDRIYLGTRAPVTVRGTASGRDVTISKNGSDATVVWNPWAQKAQAMADFGDAEWTGMVCVETCNVRDAAVHLGPGQSHTMEAVLSVAPSPARPQAVSAR